MKIGILTYHWVFNHGANLQTLSTIGYLRKIGQIPIVINWIPKDREALSLKSTIKEQIDCFRSFQKEYYPLSHLCRTVKDIADVIREEGIDKVFIGADTLLMLRSKRFSMRKMRYISPLSCEMFPNPFWGEFLDYGVHVPIIGFSLASLDTDARKFKDQKNLIKEYLKRFDYISSRDEATSKLISYFTDNELTPAITPDPVFGFNNNIDVSSLEEEILKKFSIERDYYLMSMPKPFNKRFLNWARKMEMVLDSQGYDFYELPRQTGEKTLNIKQFKTSIITPLEWYILIKNSKGYIGGLMHPIVICIHNKVPFYSFDYYGMSKFYGVFTDEKTSKVYQLIEQCGLLDYYTNIRQLSLGTFISPLQVYQKLHNFNLLQLEKSSDEMTHSLEKALSSLKLDR